MLLTFKSQVPQAPGGQTGHQDLPEPVKSPAQTRTPLATLSRVLEGSFPQDPFPSRSLIHGGCGECKTVMEPFVPWNNLKKGFRSFFGCIGQLPLILSTRSLDMKPASSDNPHQSKLSPRSLPSFHPASTCMLNHCQNYPSHPDRASKRFPECYQLLKGRNHALFILLYSSHFLAQGWTHIRCSENTC